VSRRCKPQSLFDCGTHARPKGALEKGAPPRWAESDGGETS
jgi:hypothetical protein